MSRQAPRHNRRLNLRLPRRTVLRGAALGGLSSLALPASGHRIEALLQAIVASDGFRYAKMEAAP